MNGIAAGTGIATTTALITTIVGREHLHGVGALNTLSMRAASVVTPLLGGVLVGTASAEWAYGTGAVLAIATLPLLSRVRAVRDSLAPVATEGPIRALRTGYRFVAGQPVVRGVMAAGAVGTLGAGSFVLVPALVGARFGDQPVYVGFFFSAMAVGTVLGTLGSGPVFAVTRPGMILLAAMVTSFAFLAGAGAAPLLPLAVGLMAGAGASNALEEILRYALLQLHTPDALLGRVNGAFAAQNMAGAALGALLAGVAGERLGPEHAFVAVNAALAGVSVVLLVLLRHLRTTRGSASDTT